MIGISADSNMVIGHRSVAKHGYYMSDIPNETGKLDSLPLKIYAKDIEFFLSNGSSEEKHIPITDLTLKNQEVIKSLQNKISQLEKAIDALGESISK